VNARPRAGTERARPRADAARRVALETVHAVTTRDAYANLALPGVLDRAGLRGRDAAFATELAYGTLRGLGTYDLVLAECVDRPLRKVDALLLDVLRLGTHQLLSSRVPDHAAVSATVDLARDAVGQRRAGFVNAVLRRVAAQDRAHWLTEVAPAPEVDPLGHLAVVHAHPLWVVAEFAHALGGDQVELAALLEADNAAPLVTLVARPGLATRAELVDAGGTPTPYSPLGVVWPAGSPASVAAVAQGRAGVQDEGSQLVALALAAAVVDGPGRRWLDLCAGPGGKAALLTGLAAERGAAVFAGEPQVHRAGLVARALSAYPEATGRVVVADGTHSPWRAGGFDAVIADVPCTGLGALRRRPEARWRRTPEDLAQLPVLQRALLHAGIDAVRSGGTVAYITCSPVLAETRDVVNAVLAERDDVSRIDARTAVFAVAQQPVPQLGEGPDVQLWPHRHGTDAMFLALLRRR
jgi:16S rRNA (cytosine967-C5)-methyltransferase